MIDQYKPIIAKLKTALPAHHERFVSGALQTPCFTVQEYGNRDKAYGDTVGFSQIQYMIKTWANNLQDSVTYAEQADLLMRELGFFRVSSNELLYDDLICRMSVYEAQGYEHYFEEE